MTGAPQQFEPGEVGFAAVILAGAILDSLQAKGLISVQEGEQIVRNAHAKLASSPNPDAQRAAHVLEHLYAGCVFPTS
jgi:hypothetical protein